MTAKHSRKVDAAYPKLAKKILEQIQEGIYRPGTKLPGARVLAENSASAE